MTEFFGNHSIEHTRKIFVSVTKYVCIYCSKAAWGPAKTLCRNAKILSLFLCKFDISKRLAWSVASLTAQFSNNELKKKKVGSFLSKMVMKLLLKLLPKYIIMWNFWPQATIVNGQYVAEKIEPFLEIPQRFFCSFCLILALWEWQGVPVDFWPSFSPVRGSSEL